MVQRGRISRIGSLLALEIGTAVGFDYLGFRSCSLQKVLRHGLFRLMKWPALVHDDVLGREGDFCENAIQGNREPTAQSFQSSFLPQHGAVD